MASPISKVIKYINKSGEEKEITLYDNPALFSDYDGGTYIAVQASDSIVGYIYCNSELKDNTDLFSKFLDKNGNVRYAYCKEQEDTKILIAKYSYNTNYNTLPRFNTDFEYDIKTTDNGDGTSIREIYSKQPPTEMNFYGGNNGEQLLSVDYLNTSELTDMSDLFDGCYLLTSVNTSTFDTRKVTNMSYMFKGCNALTSLDLSGFDTSKVTNMTFMLAGCNKLAEIKASNLNVSKVKNMTYVFNGCSALTSLDLSNWNTIEAATMNYMFNGCSALTSLDIRNFLTIKSTSTSRMFNTVPKTCIVYVNKSKFTKIASACNFTGSFTYVTE